jgi:GT2 family glycosyltransferase
MPSPLVVTVILNTNRRDDTLAALASLEQNDYKNHRVIVLDNASKDGSVESIRSAFPNVQIISLEENLGYAGNNNVGIKAALEMGADWVFVLNEDTIVATDCLGQMIKVGESNLKIGITGPTVYHHNEPDIIQSAGGTLDRHWQPIHNGQNEKDQGQYTAPKRVDWISGCAILVRREVIEQIGGLDERFFYYWEETDWCIRAREKGWEIWYVPQAKIWHKGVQRDYRPSPNVTYYATRNWLLVLSLHKAPLSVFAYVYWRILRTLYSWTFNSKYIEMREHRAAMWQGMIDFLHRRWGIRTV